MEDSGLGVELELQVLAYATVTVMQDLSHSFYLCHSLWQCWTLNPLSEAGDRTCILMDTSLVLNLVKHNKNSHTCFFFFFFLSFLGPHLQQIEVPRLGIELELQLPATATVTAMPDPSCVCKLYHSL